MCDERNAQTNPDEPQVYQIRIKGHLGRELASQFEGMSITEDDGESLITGTVIDQAALHGLLRKVRDLGLTIISVNPVQDS
ncbi:MAG: hypothetical protein IPK19_10690 [Chloroflexi bacterium]|nr:hypothetical protein [Chloroflexota bacterium]